MITPDILKAAFIIYAMTLLFASSYIFLPVRRSIRSWLHDMEWDFFLKYVKEDGKAPTLFQEVPGQEYMEVVHGHDFISCRMCVGFWMMVLLYFVTWGWLSWHDAFFAYALAHFANKLERKDT